MNKSGIDQQALATLFSQASQEKGDQLKQTVSDETVHALKGRKLNQQNIRQVLKIITKAVSGAATQDSGASAPARQQALLDGALQGMDEGLLQAAHASHQALQQFVDQGVSLEDTPLKALIDELQATEQVLLEAVGAAAPKDLEAPWMQALASLKNRGTESGAFATQAVAKLLAQASSGAEAQRTEHPMLESYATLASGVLIGMNAGRRPVPMLAR